MKNCPLNDCSFKSKECLGIQGLNLKQSFNPSYNVFEGFINIVIPKN